MPSTRPSTTVLYGTPRLVCSVGLKNISRYLRLPERDAVLDRLVGGPGEVLLVDKRRGDHREDLQELVDGVVVVEPVDIVRRKRDPVLPREVGERSPAEPSPRSGSAARPSGRGAGTRRIPSCQLPSHSDLQGRGQDSADPLDVRRRAASPCPRPRRTSGRPARGRRARPRRRPRRPTRADRD